MWCWITWCFSWWRSSDYVSITRFWRWCWRARLSKFESWMGEEISSNESLDDDELSWMVLLKQHGLTLILAVLLMGPDDSDKVVDFVFARLW